MAKELYRFIQTAVSQQTSGSNFYPSTLDIQESLKSGWLRKQGGVVKSWQRRWFTVKGDCVYYYSTSDESKPPLGVIFLPGSNLVEQPFNSAEPDKFVFEIVPNGTDRHRMAPTHETYPLAAESEEERREWVKTLKQVLYGSIGGAIFGRSLEDTLRFETVKDQKRKVPEIVQMCSEYIMKKGLDEEGIFRLPGRSSLIKFMCDAFDRGERPQIDVPEMDVHTAASLLKSYLRDLPGPLIPAEFYESLMRIIMREMPVAEEAALLRLNELIRSIPVANYNTLQYVCQFLGKVADHSGKNKMTSVNLATVFVQSFIKPEDDDPLLLMATTSSRTVATLVLIDRCDRIFNVEYTSEGGAVVVDDLLGLSCSHDLDESVELPMSLNPDLVGLEINGVQPAPAVLRRASARFSQEASSGDQRAGRASRAMGNRREAIIIQKSWNGSESSESVSEEPSGSSENITPNEPVPEKENEPKQVSTNVKPPVAPPRSTHQKLRSETRGNTVTSPGATSSIGSDSVAVDTLINLDTRNFSEAELRSHIDRLCQELTVRQKIIEDMNERACIAEQKHERQVNALLKKMSENRAVTDRISKQLDAYQEKYGQLD